MRIVIFLVVFIAHGVIYSQDVQEFWTLDKCLAYAVENNLRLKSFKINYQESMLNLKNERLDLLPSINASASHGYNWGQSIDPFTNEFASDRVRNNNFFLSGNWTLFNGLQTYYGIKKASHELNASKYNEMIQLRNIKIAVTAAYLQVILDYYKLRITKLAVSKTNEVYIQKKNLFKYDNITDFEMLEIESQLALDSSLMIEERNNLRLSELRLKQVMNYQDTDSLFFEFIPELIKGDNHSIEKSKVVKEDKFFTERLKAMEFSKKEVYSQLIPRLSVNSAIGSGYSGNSKDLIDGELLARPFNQQLENNFYQSATLNLEIPIFNRNQVYQQAKRIELKKELLVIEKMEQLSQIQSNIQQLELEIQSLDQKLIAQRKARIVNQKAFDIAQQRLELGLISFTQFVEIRNRYTRSKAELVTTQYQLQLKYRILEFY